MSNINKCIEAMTRRIENTKLTDIEVFREMDPYVQAAFNLIGTGYDPADRNYVLSAQILALKLMEKVTEFMQEIETELTKLSD